MAGGSASANPFVSNAADHTRPTQIAVRRLRSPQATLTSSANRTVQTRTSNESLVTEAPVRKYVGMDNGMRAANKARFWLPPIRRAVPKISSGTGRSINIDKNRSQNTCQSKGCWEKCGIRKE
jgi:hypothetical protein